MLEIVGFALNDTRFLKKIFKKNNECCLYGVIFFSFLMIHSWSTIGHFEVAQGTGASFKF